MSREAEPAPPAEVSSFYEQFVNLLRAGDVRAAQALAPGVVIETEGWPYEDETGPLNPQAFQGDPRLHRLMSWEQTGPARYLLRSGAAYFTVEKSGEDFVVTKAGLKPIE